MKIKKGTYVVDLRKEEQDILSSFDKKRRWDIKKAEKEIENIKTIKDSVAFIAVKDFKPASIILVRFNDEEKTAIYSRSISLSEYKSCQFISLLLWEAMKYSKSKGYDKFDLGGIDLSPTQKHEKINGYKSKFKGDLKVWEEKVSFVHWLKWKLKKWFKKQ